jgi:hypothetical protein
VQNEIVDGAAHVWDVMSQVPPQQSVFALQALPAVWQLTPSCWHLPLWHAFGPLQHATPPAVHEAPSVTHCCVLQVPPEQFKLQQSPALVQLLPAPLHCAAEHWCVLGSQTFEQHWLFAVQLAVLWRHRPPSPPEALRSPPPADMSMPLPVLSL